MVIHLENYSRDWDEKHSVWRSQPRHDDHSHAADAFMTFADGYKTPTSFVLPARKPIPVV